MTTITQPLKGRYSYDEFAEHLKAMHTVRHWEYTARFGQVGSDQTSRANNARVLEYFLDCCADPQEAVGKAEVFLSICDYLGRHQSLFARKGFVEVEAEGGELLSVEPALLRAVHYLFTVASQPAQMDPKKVLDLGRAFQALA